MSTIYQLPDDIAEVLKALGLDGDEAVKAAQQADIQEADRKLARAYADEYKWMSESEDNDRKLAETLANEMVVKQTAEAEEREAADRKLALSLAGGYDRKVESTPATVETDLLQAEYGQWSPLKVRTDTEEQATAALLGGVDQYVVASKVNDDGSVTIGGKRYTRLECGGSHAGHYNLCGYLSFTSGDGPAAVALKQRLAPRANEFALLAGVSSDFAGGSVMMDTEVIRAYAEVLATPVCVYNARAGVATTYRTSKSVKDCVYIYTSGAHFQRLLPA